MSPPLFLPTLPFAQNRRLSKEEEGSVNPVPLAGAPELHCAGLKSGDRNFALEPRAAVGAKIAPRAAQVCGQVPPLGQDGELDGAASPASPGC